MNPISSSTDFQKVSRRFDSHLCVVARCRAFSLFVFAMFAMAGNVLCAFGQAPPPPKPITAPETKQGPKRRTADTAPPASTTGTINGLVITSDGRPVVNATVVAQAGFGAVTPRVSQVDLEGRFVLEDLSPAAYVVSASAPGYIDQSLSQGDPSQWPRYLIGSELKITMIKGGVITGTVTNSKGDPIVGAPVNAARISDSTISVLALRRFMSTDETDDRGVYRIYGLLPGQYTVTAGGGGLFGQFNAGGFDLDVPTYYPSATRDGAVPVTVRSGEETTEIDIKYRGIEGHSVSGVVTGAIETGASLGGVSIMLANAGSNSITSFAIAKTVDQRRVFSFSAVADGEYDLMASFQQGLNDSPLFATKRVIVRGGDVTGIELNLALLASIAGTISLDPIKPEDKCDKRASEIIETVLTTSRDEPVKSGSPILTQLFAGAGGSLNANGEFTIPNLEASKYRLGLTLPTDAWYVRAIIPPQASQSKSPAPAGATSRPGDLWQGVITLRASERYAPLKILIAQDAAGLSGRIVTTPDSAIPVGMRVHLVPEERDRFDNILRYSETTANRDGSFSFTNLAPGRYFVVARTEPPAENQSTIPRPLAWDPAVRSILRREAAASNKIVELKPCQRLVDVTLER